MTSYSGYLAGTRFESDMVKGSVGDWYDWTPERGLIVVSRSTGCIFS